MNLLTRLSLATVAQALIVAVIPHLALAQVINIGPELLPQDEAFSLDAQFVDDKVVFNVAIADGYYLYRDRTDARTLVGSSALDVLDLPPGKVHVDEFFGEVQTYRGDISFGAPVASAAGSSDMLVELIVQGCADVGVCFPPYVTRFAFSGSGGPGTMVFTNAQVVVEPLPEPVDNTDLSFQTLASGSLSLIVLVFFSAGVLLSFTPCVLPMVPIVLAVTSGGARPGGMRSLALGGTYVLGMAFVYTAIGIFTASSGKSFLAGSLQNAWIIVPLVVVFIALGVAMLMEFNMRLLPAPLIQRLEKMRGRPGTYSGALLAGTVAAIVVSPCVAAPLVGALLFIATTGDVVIGGLALLALALGMGVLPLACAAGAGSFLPRTGPLSVAVRKLFGLLLIGLGVWVLGVLVVPTVKMIAYATLSFVGVVVLLRAAWSADIKGLARSVIGTVVIVLFALGSLMLVGGLTGGTNDLAPLAHLIGDDDQQLQFEVISTEADYRTFQAVPARQGTFEYYYADWCVSCRELEGYTYRDPEVIAALDGYRLLKVDLSANDTDARRLLAMGNLFGPPAIVLRGPDGRQLLRYAGYVDRDQLLAGLQQVKSTTPGG